MSTSNTVTKNDLKAVLEALPLIPSEYKKLLWTNPSPSSTFAAQTISLSLTDYDAVEIEYNNTDDSDGATNSSIILEQSKSATMLLFHSIYSAQVNNNVGTRRVSWSSSGVVFTDYKYKNYINGTSLTTSNQFCVPYKIYGIKYERVNPPQVEVADYVVDQGISGIWTYRKWNSGIAECWGYQTKTASGTGVNFTLTFPSSLFIANPTAVCSAGVNGEASAGINYVNATTSYVDAWVYRSSSTSNSVWVYAHALGRWK